MSKKITVNFGRMGQEPVLVPDTCPRCSIRPALKYLGTCANCALPDEIREAAKVAAEAEKAKEGK